MVISIIATERDWSKNGNGNDNSNDNSNDNCNDNCNDNDIVSGNLILSSIPDVEIRSSDVFLRPPFVHFHAQV